MIFAFFFLSGACALAYEIIWTRQLTLLAGTTTAAVSTVLAVFMGGLALGARLLGPLADRGRFLLRWYAALELGIGLFALAQPGILFWMDKAYLYFIPRVGHPGINLLALRIGVAAIVLLVPAILMGGTLPILVRHVSRRTDRLGWDLGTLYSTNLAGAVLGGALTGFLLIRTLGMTGTILATVLVNLSIGIAALWLSFVTPPLPSKQSASPASERIKSLPPALRVILWAVVTLSGLLTMGYEVTWTRILIFAFGSTIYSFTIILIIFLLGLAFGSMLFSRLDGRVDGIRFLSVSLFLAAAGALALAPLAPHLPEWTQSLSSILGFTGGMQLGATIAGSILVMLFPATMMGVLFPLGSRLLIDNLEHSGETIGKAYWFNTLGSIGGSFLAGFLLIPLLSIKGCLLVLAGLQVLMAIGLLPWSRLKRRSSCLAGLSGLALVAAIAAGFLRTLPGACPFDRIPGGESPSPGEAPDTIKAHRDDAAASVTVVHTPTGINVLRINGFEATSDSSGSGYMPLMSHLPMLLHGDARRVLVICFGTGSTAGAALLHPDAKVDAVDINRSVLDFAPWFGQANHGVQGNPRATLILDDGRNFLATTPNYYDVITSEPMPPTQAGVVNLYSREYYALAKARLNPGGILVQWLPFHLLTVEESLSVLRTVQEVFPETTLWLWNTTGLIVARKGAPVSVDLAALLQAYKYPELAADLARLEVPTPEEFLQLFTLGPSAVSDLTEGAPIITDDHPSLEFHPPRHGKTFATPRGITPSSAAMLSEVLQRRASAEPPVDGISAESRKTFLEAFRLRNIQLTGDLYFKRGLPAEAAEVFERGLAESTTAADRATFLFNLAVTAQERGDQSGSLAYIERCLVEAPENRMALELQGRLRAHAPEIPGR